MPVLLPRARRGGHVEDPRVQYEQVGSFRLRVGQTTRIHVDGEIRELEAGEHSVRLKPKVFEFVVADDAPALRGESAGATESGVTG